MAAYVTKADLVERYGLTELVALTDQVAATTADDSEIGKACDEASSEIDTALCTRYTLPLSPVPTIIRLWACVIARKNLWKDRANAEHAVTRAYDNVVRQLRDVARGTSGLPDADGVKAPSTGGVAYSTPCRVTNTVGLL